MCGIVAAAAGKNIVPVLIEGLKKLEYRGYDSAGIAVIGDNAIERVRAVGRVAELDAALTAGIEPRRLRLQDLDLTDYHGLDRRTDLDELVVLGGTLSPALDAHLRAHGAIIFPNDPDAAPIRPYRARLYTADELYADLAREAYKPFENVLMKMPGTK